MLLVVLLNDGMRLSHTLEELIPFLLQRSQLKLIFFLKLRRALIIIGVVLNECKLLLDLVQTGLKLRLLSSDLGVADLIALKLFKLG